MVYQYKNTFHFLLNVIFNVLIRKLGTICFPCRLKYLSVSGSSVLFFRYDLDFIDFYQIKRIRHGHGPWRQLNRLQMKNTAYMPTLERLTAVGIQGLLPSPPLKIVFQKETKWCILLHFGNKICSVKSFKKGYIMCYRFSCYYRFSDIAINSVNPSFI